MGEGDQGGGTSLQRRLVEPTGRVFPFQPSQFSPEANPAPPVQRTRPAGSTRYRCSSTHGPGCLHASRLDGELALAEPGFTITGGGRPRPRTGSSGAVAGTTTPGTAARRTATGTSRTTGTTTSVSVWPQPSGAVDSAPDWTGRSPVQVEPLSAWRTTIRTAPCW